MRELSVQIPGRPPYPIYIGTGLLSQASELVAAIAGRQVMVVSDENVAPLHRSSLALGGAESVDDLVLPAGEPAKDLATFSRVIDAMVGAGLRRDGIVIALGGGVVGDIAGFAAACYQRGVAVIQCPTTLLAQVDSSVGGKTGVNHPGGKNLIGAFHQPLAVLADLETLTTLPEREYRAGLAEVIKHALLADPELLADLEAHMPALLQKDPELLEGVVGRCCEIKAAVVADDEREAGDRALLNLGHTFGHAIENAAGYGCFLHGEAVAIGLIQAARLSQLLGHLDEQDAARVSALVRAAGLPEEADGVDAAAQLRAMGMDKKAGPQGLRFVVLETLGRAALATGIPEATIMAAITGDG